MQQGLPAYWVSQHVTVGTDDIADLTVQLRPALRVEGRVEFRGGEQRAIGAADGSPASIFETPFGEPGQFAVAATRGATLSFSTVAAGGRYIVRPYELGGWFVQSVTVDGKDITDRVFDLQADATSLVVTFTDQPSKVSGTVKDARGAASPTAIVLAFPVDPKRWSGYGASPRNLKSALASRTGVYTFEHLPPGDYYVIAVDPAEADGWQDPTRLEALAGQATKLTVAAGDTQRRSIFVEGDPMIGRSSRRPRRRDRVRRARRGGAAAGARQRARRGRYRVDLRHGVRGRRDEAAGAPRARDAHGCRAHLARSDRRPPTTAARSPFAVCRRAGSSCRRSRTPISAPATARRGRIAPGTPIVVKDGEAVANLAMTIARGGVITGVVRDVRGRPVPGVNVRVLKLGYNAVTGERTLGAPSSGSAAVTDDRGEYRAYGLPPGGYLVLVAPGSSVGARQRRHSPADDGRGAAGAAGGPLRRATTARVQRPSLHVLVARA